MPVLRQLARRKLRTTLTIVGITIGIWSLVVFSAMANKIDSLVSGGSQFFADKVIVNDAAGGGFGALPMRLSDAERIAAIEGVDVAFAQVVMLLDEEIRVSFGVPAQIIGQVAGADQGRETFTAELARGRALTLADEGSRVVVVGSDLATKLGAEIGRSITLHGEAFEVVGILLPTLTAPDNEVIIPLQAGQELLWADLPQVVKDAVAPDEILTQVVVFPEAGSDPAAVADRIEASVANTVTLTGAEFDEQVGSSLAIFNTIIIGVALISLIVGGLSVINTMAMSVAERTREIGIKRAIGGTRRRIVRELVTEAGAIGFLGGLIGLGLGVLVVVLINDAGRASGTILFEMRTSTAIFAVAFSTILGTLAGIIPAVNASRLDPVDALRYE
jgi:putative ABC transport system permease protein